MNWQTPPKPTYTTGRIVLHSDDGRIWDYTHYFRVIQRAIFSRNQYVPKKCGVFCPAPNTAYIDSGVHDIVGLPTMTWEQLQDIATSGGEILSHGKYHLCLDGNAISQPLTIGATKIYYTASQGRPLESFKFYITDGVNRDDFIVTSYTHLGAGQTNSMDIDTPITHAYTTSAKVYLHEDMIDEELGGIITDLANYGIECKHHINAWYTNSITARQYLETHFESVIANIVTGIEDPSTVDLYNLGRTKDLRHYTFSQIDTDLNDVQVAPRAGAWIETPVYPLFHYQFQRRPSCGGVD